MFRCDYGWFVGLAFLPVLYKHSEYLSEHNWLPYVICSYMFRCNNGWFVGLAFLPVLYKHSEYLSEHNWQPYVILCAFAIAGRILILCLQKVNFVLRYLDS